MFYKPDAVPAIFKDLNADHQRMFDILKESGLKWIAILPPHISSIETFFLSFKTRSIQLLLSLLYNYCNYFTGSENLEYIIKHDESPGRAISKYALGAFLVDCLGQSDHYQKVCGIATSS